jgi:putative membrane protein
MLFRLARSIPPSDAEAAQQALQKSHNPDVRAFAEDMVRDHTAVNERALALVKKLHSLRGTIRLASAAKAGRQRAPEGLPSCKARVSIVPSSGRSDLPPTDESSARTHLMIFNPELKSLLTTGLKIFQGYEQHTDKVVVDLKG